MSAEIPKVLVLGPITPAADSARSNVLEYTQLEPAVIKHAPHEYKRINRFWEAEEGSLAEQEAAQQLAMQYMLMGSLALNRGRNPALWSERYTQATSEIYGLPEPEIARTLWEERQNETVEIQVPFSSAAEKARSFLNETYKNVFDALDINSSSETIDPNGIADRFEAGLAVLATEHDADWSNWSIERNEEKDSLSVVAGDKKILVGLKRASVEPQQLKALFAHEVLVHGLRGVNGQKVSKQLGTGLPGYLDAEEGFGVFVEYAISGGISQKNIDRYIDIAFALGQIDGEQHTRQELVNIAMSRAMQRNESTGSKKTVEDITKEVYAHVNRIYRGSLGNEHVGVFTKDISYHKGFVDMGRYIQAQVELGKSMQEIFRFLSVGKFDPTNQAHLDYVRTNTDLVG